MADTRRAVSSRVTHFDRPSDFFNLMVDLSATLFGSGSNIGLARNLKKGCFWGVKNQTKTRNMAKIGVLYPVTGMLHHYSTLGTKTRNIAIDQVP